MKENEIWLVKIPELKGHEQYGFRPAVIKSGNANITTIIPFTSNEKALKYKFTFELNPNSINNLDKKSIALIFQIGAIDNKKIVKKIGELTEYESNKIDSMLEDYLFKKISIINKEKLAKYFSVTEEALAEAIKNIFKGREEDAKEIIEMVKNYVSDAHHFEKKNDLVNAFAAINYAHGWLDCGVRQGIFDVKNRDLFTIK